MKRVEWGRGSIDVVTTMSIPHSTAFSLLAALVLSPLAAQEVPEGHRRMLVELQRIADDTDTDNPYLGEAPATAARARLLAAVEISAPVGVRWRLLIEIAKQELRLGRESLAIERFLAAYELQDQLGVEVTESERIEAVFQTGVAYLRMAETRNCAQRHNADSCILPIQGEGVHRDRTGSEQAMRYFREVLRRAPRRPPTTFLKAVWLLNLAAMTLGEHPSGVEPQYRFDLSAFGSEEVVPRFRNVGPALGLDTMNLSGGTVFDDLDGDLDLDLFTTTFDGRENPRLLLNQGDGTFVDRTKAAGLRGLYGGLNANHADYDNDGDVDLLVLRGAWLRDRGRHPNSLLRNEGDGRFVDVTFEAGLGEVHYPTQTAAWADYDNDGDLDLYIGNEHVPGVGFSSPCQLFRNNGDGTFTDVAEEAGVALRAYVKGVVWGDYDEDRHADLYVSVLGEPNSLFRNNADGTFTDVAATAGVQMPRNSFPVWFWDYDNDGHLDIYVSSYKGSPGAVGLVAASYARARGNWELARLYHGDGRGGFRDVATDVGLTKLHLTMGSNFGDLDNDGYLDFYLGTGYPEYEAVMPNVLYLGRGGRRFVDVTVSAGLGHLQKGHAVAFADFDGDGDLDVFEQMGGALPGDRFGDALYLNPGFGRNWIELILVGTESNRSAIGARIRVDFSEDGKPRSVYRHVTSGSSFGGNPFRQMVGLGSAKGIDRVEIYWPKTDLSQVFEGVEMNRRYVAEEGKSEMLPVGP